METAKCYFRYYVTTHEWMALALTRQSRIFFAGHLQLNTFLINWSEIEHIFDQLHAIEHFFGQMREITHQKVPKY